MRMTWNRVTTDPEQHAHLLEKEREIGTVKLVEYAHSLGLFPPGYPEVDCGISVAWAPENDDSEGTLIWDTEPDVAQAEDDDGENPWEGVVSSTEARQAD